MRDVYDVVIQPVITEKTTRQMEENVYTFLVDERANKVDIGRAVEKIFDVEVEDVRTMRYAGKVRRAMLGRMAGNWQNPGRRRSFKKALVRVAEGQHIEIYEAG